MTDIEHRRRIEALCDAALDREPRERAAFVATACGPDEDLRQEVEALLEHAQAAETFLTSPLGEVAAHVLADGHGASLVGRQLGSHEVRALLGVGGMGEVYRAHDAKLGRDVAIKVVANALLADPERLARFEREAKVLAQLNHPNIAQVHGLEVEGEVRALVMELVEGPTLADRLAKGALPLDDCLEIARQIASALEAAHEKGIVHRDLKPENVKAPEGGTVKVLDFGLAKALAAASSGSDAGLAADSPTITSAAPADRGWMGTAAYMSPEQAKRSPVDGRADLWALGVVLFEMLSGRRS